MRFYGHKDLAPFQKEDVAWLLEPLPNGDHHKLLANGMGTGKTPITCVALDQLRALNVNNVCGISVLLICPCSIKDGFEDEATAWKQQLMRWGGFWEDQIQVIMNGSDFPGAAVVIVNPEMLVRSEPLQRALMRRTFTVCVIDEAHSLKNASSKIVNLVLANGAHALIARSKYKWLLSGSIIPNRAIEIFPIAKALYPDGIKPYLRRDDFARYFCGGEFDGREVTAPGSAHMEELAERLAPFMRRRELVDVEAELPECYEQDIYVDTGDLGGIDESNTPLATLRRIIGESKVPHVIRHIEDLFLLDGLKKTPEKLLVFTYSQSVTEALVDGLSSRGAVAFYGPLSATKRAENIKRFKTDYTCRVLIGQMQAIGTGVDGLQHYCSDIVYAEEDWTEEYVNQQIARLWRRGQRNTVNVQHIIAQGTYDAKIPRTRQRKDKPIRQFYAALKEKCEVVSSNGEHEMIEDELKEIKNLLAGILEALSGEETEGATAKPGKGGGRGKKTDSATSAGPAASAAGTAAPAAQSAATAAPPTVDDVVSCAVSTLDKITGDTDDETILTPARARIRAVVDPIIGEGVSVSETPAEKRAAVIAAINGVDTSPVVVKKKGLGM